MKHCVIALFTLLGCASSRPPNDEVVTRMTAGDETVLSEPASQSPDPGQVVTPSTSPEPRLRDRGLCVGSQRCRQEPRSVTGRSGS